MKHLLSFADTRMKRSLERLSKQALVLNFFDAIHLKNENNLPTYFKEKFKNNLILGSKGYGYWSWKPEIIKHTLDQMHEEDTLLYIDAGCHLNKKGVWRLEEYFEILKKSDFGIVAFQAIPPSPNISPLNHDGRKLFDQLNYQWIKGDLFDHFNARYNKKYTHAEAIGATVILLKKCKNSLALIEEWRSIISLDFSLLNDAPSKSPNLAGFVEHRHDQAIFSLLCIKYNIPTLSAYEYWYPRSFHNKHLEPDWSALKNFPIHAKRDKNFGLVSKMKRVISSLLMSNIKNIDAL